LKRIQQHARQKKDQPENDSQYMHVNDSTASRASKNMNPQKNHLFAPSFFDARRSNI
jgi:hypothetical protein